MRRSLLTTTAVALAFTAAVQAQDSKAELEAEQYVIKFGGRVIRDVSHVSKGMPVFAVSLDAKDAIGFELKRLAVFPKLYRLTFSGSKNTDAALKQLKDVPSVTSVSLDDSDVTDDGLALLSALPKLRDLDVTRAGKITELGLKSLAKCPLLETLNLSETAITNECLVALAGLKNLTELRLCKCKVNLQETAAAFQAWTRLRVLDATAAGIDDAGLLPISVARNLEVLNLTGANITDAALKPLNKLVKLKSLNLCEAVKITGRGFENLDALSQLETLYLNDTITNDAGLAFIARLRNIKTLDLDRTKLSDEGLRELATPRGLESLSVEETLAGNAGLLAIAEKAKKLQKVSARKSKITASGVVEAQKKAPELSVSLD